MRYVKGDGLQTGRRIVEHASYGLRQRGGDGLSVVDLMKFVGLTHGGFYSHFASRDRTFAHWAAPSIHRRIGRRTDQHM